MSERKADRVAKDLLARVVSGAFEVGSVLPKESDLSARYGVNKSVVREAIKQLEVHQLVRPVKRRGTEVLDPIASYSPEVVEAMLIPAPGRIDLALLADVLEVRAHIDEHMSGLAAERRTAEDLLAIDEAVAGLRAALGESRRYARQMNDLSLAFARATHNRVFEILAHWHIAVHACLEDLFMLVRTAAPPHLEGIEALVERIRMGDSETARAFVRAYHEWATPRLMTAARIANGEPIDG